MKKLLFVLLACCILAMPAFAADDELKNLSDQQLLAVYDAVLAEIQARSLNTSAQTPRDASIVFGQNIHVQQGELTVCLPTAVPNTGMVQLPIVPTATPLPIGGDKAAYDSQNPTDGYHVQPGQAFDIYWYLLNTGTTTWTTDYTLRFWSGTNMTKPGKTRYGLLETTAPNTVGRIAVDVVAPTTRGSYTMAMVFGNERDENFFTVDITIIVD